MNASESEHVQAIERVLGRSLRDDEMVRVDALAQLTPAERSVAKTLAQKQLVLCAHYLRLVAPVGVGEASRFIDDLLAAEVVRDTFVPNAANTPTGMYRAQPSESIDCATCGDSRGFHADDGPCCAAQGQHRSSYCGENGCECKAFVIRAGDEDVASGRLDESDDISIISSGPEAFAMLREAAGLPPTTESHAHASLAKVATSREFASVVTAILGLESADPDFSEAEKLEIVYAVELAAMRCLIDRRHRSKRTDGEFAFPDLEQARRDADALLAKP